jgi:hypothetical protein
VDKAKAISLLQNLHNLTPPSTKEEDPSKQVAIIEALKVTPRLLYLFLEIRGIMWDDNKKESVQIVRPIMNLDGAYRFVKVLQHIAEETEWSNFHEDELNARILRHFENNYAYFTFWHEDYDLAPSDFNYINTTLMAFIDSSFHKAKGGKFVNLPGRVYSEDFLGKALREEQKKPVSFIDKLNPFKKQ